MAGAEYPSAPADSGTVAVAMTIGDALYRRKEGPMHTRDEIRLTTLAACAG